jgi:hypothetical protein
MIGATAWRATTLLVVASAFLLLAAASAPAEQHHSERAASSRAQGVLCRLEPSLFARPTTRRAGERSNRLHNEGRQR